MHWVIYYGEGLPNLVYGWGRWLKQPFKLMNGCSKTKSGANDISHFNLHLLPVHFLIATPQHYTCLVKSAYVKSHFAYPVQLYVIAGFNTTSSDSFSLVYNSENSYTFKSLPPNAVTDIASFGSVLSLFSTYDSK